MTTLCTNGQLGPVLVFVILAASQASTPIAAQTASDEERFMSDEEFLKIGQDFDLDAFIKGLNPPTVGELLKSLEPIPTREEILELLRHRDQLPKPPALPEEVQKEVEKLDQEIAELTKKGALGDDESAQLAALDRAVQLAERVVALRIEAGQPPHWYEVVDSKQRAETLKHARDLSPSDRNWLAAAAARLAEGEQAAARGDSAEALAFAGSRLRINSRLLSDDHPVVATTLNSFASILDECGGYEEASELLCRAAIAIRHKCFPGDHPDLAVSLDTMANVLGSRGAWRQAELFRIEALAMLLRLFSVDDDRVSLVMNNLALTLQSRGALREAEPLYRESLAIDQRLSPGDSINVATGLGNLGYVLRARGSLDQAEQFRRDSLGMFSRIYKGDHPQLAMAIYNLASVLSSRGKLEEAEPLYRDALAMNQRIYPNDHRYVAYCLTGLGYVLYERGANEQSESLYLDALAMFRRLNPGDHPDIAPTLNALASVLRRRQALDQAELRSREALAMSQRLYAGDHPRTLVCMQTLATLLDVRGAEEEAATLQREALAIARRLYPGDHPEAAQILNQLAEVLLQRGSLEEAEQVSRDSVATFQRLYPADHPSTVRSLLTLSMILEAKGAIENAVSVLSDAFTMSERLRTHIIGSERERAEFAHQLRLKATAHNYAHSLDQLGRDGEALGILERGRALAALDLLQRSGRDLAAEATAIGDDQRTSRLDHALAAEQQAKVALNDAENLLAGCRRERNSLEVQSDLDAEEKAHRLGEYDREIGRLVEEVKRRYGALKMKGGDVLTELQGLFPAGQALTREEILAALAPDEAIISFSWSSTSVLVAIAFKGSASVQIIAEGEDAVKGLNTLVAQVQEAMSSASLRGLEPDLVQKLCSPLFPETIAREIGSAKRLVVLPDGPLIGIPFEVLLESFARQDGSPGDRPAIVYAPSATIYLNLKRHGVQSRGRQDDAPIAVVLGGPNFGASQQSRPDYPKEGVLLAQVMEDGNAAAAGLRRGDVLLKYGAEKLTAATELGPATQRVGAARAETGQRDEHGEETEPTVTVTYWRDGTEHETRVKPGKLGVYPHTAPPDAGLRSMTTLDQATRGGGEALTANASVLEQVRLFDENLKPLPGSAREAHAIAKVLTSAGVRPTTLTGRDAKAPALWHAVSTARPRYLHLATHGLIGSAVRPLDASLALAQPDQPTLDDIGFLRLEDLMSRWGGKLEGCELVVLSACDTQRGIRLGDTDMSLPLGFFFAGAHTVVASLWKVDDTATTLLMTRFYENLLGQFKERRELGDREFSPGTRMSKLESLDEAKAWLRSLTGVERDRLLRALEAAPAGVNESTKVRGDGAPQVVPASPPDPSGGRPYEHPYYWAAFVLIGDPE